MNHLIDILQAVAFDIDFSDIDWTITDTEMFEQLAHGRDDIAADPTVG